jgi:Flp pilus assembly protein TadD
MSVSELRQQLGEAARLAQDGQLDQAARLCQVVLQQAPGQPNASFLLGMVECQRGRPEAAVDHLQTYVRHASGDANARYNLGVALQQAGRFAEAAGAYRKALDFQPAMIPATVNLSACMEQLGQGEAAEVLLSRQCQRHPANLTLGLAHGGLLMRLHRIDDGIHRLEQLHQHNPAQAGPLIKLGKALVESGRLDEARQRLEQALTLEPDAVEAHLSLTVAYSRLGDFEAADRHVRRAIELDPGSASAQFNLAALYSKKTRPEDLQVADEACRAAIQRSPQHAGAWHCLGIVLGKLGQLDDGIRAARKATELDATNPAFEVTLGDLLVNSGDLDESQRVLSEAADRFPDFNDASRQLGITCLKQRAPKAALKALNRALGVNPVDQRSIAHLAVAHQQMGDHTRAEDYLGLDRHIYPVELDLPDGFSDMAEFNRALAHDIREHSLFRWEPIGLAARNGGLTEDLLADRTPATLGFEASLRRAIDDLRGRLSLDPNDPFLQAIPGDGYEINIWATLCREGGNIDTHIHEESWLSGAYYVELPDDLGDDESDPSGWIEFGRPHAEVPFPEDATVRLVKPQEGLLVLFPSYLFHRTIPHRGDSHRISVSFDLIRKQL